jgi:diguanylate cyclase (GGDEF)-like protein
MDSDSCDGYPMNRIRGENAIAVMPFYYRDTEHPSGVVVFEGDLRCKDSKLEGFAKSFWAMKTAMAATAQIAFQLTHKFDAITVLTKTADFYVDFKSGIADLLWNGTKSLYLVLLDVDDFKKVNDNYGYQRGNDVLRRIAGTIKASVRNGDVVSRWGGEEFAVILKDVSKAEAETIAERIRANVERSSIRSRNGEIKVTCSIGVTDVGPIAEHVLAARPADAISSISDMAFDTSDQSLKYAKRNGKNQVCFSQAESLNRLQ